MKRFIAVLFSLGLIVLTIYELDRITDEVSSLFYEPADILIPDKNSYSKEANYEYVGLSSDFRPYNYQELLNVFYTVLDSGFEKFTFYCPTEYHDCLKDVEQISNPDSVEVLTTLGNLVSPFNNFATIRVQYDTAGEVTIDIEKLYSKADITMINEKLDHLWATLVDADMTKKDIIYAFHDHIINTTRYDEAYEEEVKTGKTTYQSSKAIGPLFEGFGICSGYTDVMALVLDRLEVANFKVASSTHVWNAVLIDDEWLHLDLTWDDPVSVDHSKDTLLHKFYLINTETLEEFDINDHSFNKSVYRELA